ncbi:MAG: outer membrane beta-barrel protein [Arenicellales bacterium]
MRIEGGREPSRRGWNTGARFAGLLTVLLTVSYSGVTLAEGPEFGIAPAANTQRALSSSPTKPTQKQEGLYAAVGVAYLHRSNVRRDSVAGASSQGDSAVVITPQAGYKTYLGRHTAEVGISSQFTRFKDLTDENSSNYTAHALTNLDISRKLGLDLFGTFTHTAEPRGGSGTRLVQSLTPDEVDITGYGGVFTIGQRSSRIQIEAGADRSQWRYQNNGQQYRDRDDDRFHGRVYYNISPRTSVFVGAHLMNVDYRQSGLDLNSQELGYDVGGRWDITAKTTGEVSAGQTKKDFDDPTLTDPTTTTVAGRLSWTPRQRTTVDIYGSRDFEESTATAGDFYISELIGATVRESIGDRLGAFVYANNTKDHYDSGRRDELWDYGVGLDYSLRRWLSIGAQYSRITRDSNLAGENYNDQVISLYLNGSLSVGAR